MLKPENSLTRAVLIFGKERQIDLYQARVTLKRKFLYEISQPLTILTKDSITKMVLRQLGRKSHQEFRIKFGSQFAARPITVYEVSGFNFDNAQLYYLHSIIFKTLQRLYKQDDFTPGKTQIRSGLSLDVSRLNG